MINVRNRTKKYIHTGDGGGVNPMIPSREHAREPQSVKSAYDVSETIERRQIVANNGYTFEFGCVSAIIDRS